MTSTNPIPTSSNQRSMGNPPGDQSPSNSRSARIAIALGDPAGIGAEVTLKALADPRWQTDGLQPVLVGCRRWLEASFQALKQQGNDLLRDPGELEVLDRPLAQAARPGQSTAACGDASFSWLSDAVELVQSGECRALVTAPIAKASWHAAGHAYPGQTERLAELAGVQEASMLFTARAPGGQWRLNTLLATTHIPLRAVPDQLNAARLHSKLDALLDFCTRFTPTPHLAVAGLNPHAGEGGALGHDEEHWLNAALASWQAQHPAIRLEGPLPADTCWLSAAAAWRGAAWQEANGAEPPGVPPPRAADGYLALYHDQGLIPVKLLAFDAAVNTTLGLPFLRTSPDHGTAFAIAGRGVARPQSMAAAIETAWELG